MKKGDLVVVEFLDHTQGTHRPQGFAPAQCRAVGWLFEDNPTFMVLSAWVSINIDDEDCDHLTIVKHKGMKIRRLRCPKL